MSTCCCCWRRWCLNEKNKTQKRNQYKCNASLLLSCLLVMPYRISLTSLERTSVPINLAEKKNIIICIISRSSGAAAAILLCMCIGVVFEKIFPFLFGRMYSSILNLFFFFRWVLKNLKGKKRGIVIRWAGIVQANGITEYGYFDDFIFRVKNCSRFWQ